MDSRPSAAKTVGAIAVIIIAIVAIFYSCQAHNDWKESCERRGGHVSSHTNRAGDVADTTYYCLNGDGGIIDIR